MDLTRGYDLDPLGTRNTSAECDSFSVTQHGSSNGSTDVYVEPNITTIGIDG